eukprot:CAMPEP_0115603266 /NCGR_PEP_ID=MMETSP0272-20121206/16338_1 /TAXON_ID=71861 /ORGANISM="Scrippsiella trochoidea, Strain CCMP3099" /LENGTH=471 /DNA_ID=CAMNT_0003038781 /DNA_START=872 /DNA_END=2287 /DNA_ORIENTATION=-
MCYLIVGRSLERRRAVRRTEEGLRRALADPFRAELEEGFGMNVVDDVEALEPGLGTSFVHLPLEDKLHAEGLVHLQSKRRLLIAARRRLLRSEVAGDALLPSRLSLHIRRPNLLHDSMQALLVRPIAELLAPSMSVGFEGEQGVDAGGLSRDWFDSVARALADIELGCAPLAATAPDATLQLRPATLGRAEVDGMRASYAAGRFLALAILREQPLPILISPLICKHLLLQPIGMRDVRQFDPDFFRHRVERLLEPDGVAGVASLTCQPELRFLSAPTAARPEPWELMPGGAAIVVTEDSKTEYIRLLCEARACGEARHELTCLLHGFWDVLPWQLLSSHKVSAEELSALISGTCDPDPAEWRKHSRSTSARGQAAAQVVEWFWEAVACELAPDSRSALLRFATGASRPPAGGFADLKPRFSVEVSALGSPDHLPQAHTCANKLVLHLYHSKAQLLEKLLLAISSDEGFGTA